MNKHKKPKKKKTLKRLFVQFIKFGIVGLSNTAISLGVYYLLIYFGMHYILANFLGFVVSVINAFFWSSRFVFTEGEETSKVKSFSKVFVTYGGSFLVSTCLITIFVEVFRISEWLAPLLRLLVTVPLNFILNKFWAFKEKI